MMYFKPARKESVLAQGRLVAQRFARMAEIEQAEAHARILVRPLRGGQGGVPWSRLYCESACMVARAAAYVQLQVRLRGEGVKEVQHGLC